MPSRSRLCQLQMFASSRAEISRSLHRPLWAGITQIKQGRRAKSPYQSTSTIPLVHCCTLFLCYLDAEIGEIDDQYRNPNINNRDHLVGQLTIIKITRHCTDSFIPFHDLCAFSSLLFNIIESILMFKHRKNCECYPFHSLFKGH